MTGMLDFDIGTAVNSVYDDAKFPTIQIDAYGGKQSGVPPYEQHSPCGFIGRPHDPDTDADGNPTKGCTVLYALEGEKGHVWPSHDPRIVPLLPPLTKGGSAQYGGKLKNPSFHYISGDTGSQTIYVPYEIVNDVATKAMSIFVNVDEKGDEHISIIHGEGMSITMIAGGKNSIVLKNKAGDGYLEVNDEGTVVNGQLTLHGGLVAGVGGPGLPPTELVRSDTLIIFLGQICAQIGALATFVGAGAPGILVPGNPAVGIASAVAALVPQFVSIKALNTKGV